MNRRIKSKIAWLCVLALLAAFLPQFTLSARADASGQCGDNLYWSFNESTGTLTITGSGEMTDWNDSETVPWYSLRERIRSVSFSISLISIGQYAFHGCSNLTSLTIPNSVSSIGIRAFSECSALTSVTIPDSVSSIGGGAFSGCINLTSVAIGNGVKRIDRFIFENCSSLTSVTIPDGVESILPLAFSGCSSLTSVTIPKSVTFIGMYAFNECNSLTDVYYGGDAVMWGNVSTQKGNNALNCNMHFNSAPMSEKSGALGDHLTWSFDDDTGKLTITGSGAMTNWATSEEVPWYSFAGNIRSLSLPDGLTSIGAYAFYLCNGLTNVTIPDQVISIGKYAFQYCGSLKSASLGKGVVKIDEGIFRDCDNLTSVTIRNSKCDIYQSSSTTLGDPGRTTIYGYKGSTAEQFAKDKGYQFKDLSEQFVDVNATAFYAEPVAWAVEKGVTNGTSSTTFSPNDTCTRGQVVTFLHRSSGSEAPESTQTPFSDVGENAFYARAVAWAVEKNITTGTSKTTFSPAVGCTRGQVVTFLWRAKGCPEPQSMTNPFTDVKQNAFYYDAVLWAVENKVTSGVSKTSFAPAATCTRGQIVTFLYRAMGGK